MEAQKQIYKDNWKKYLELGLIPLPAKGKSPIVKWQELTGGNLCLDDYEVWEEKYPNSNIWVLLGEYLVVEPECQEAEDFIKSLNLPRCPTSISGGKSTHRWFKNNGIFKPFQIVKDGLTFLEVRTGKMGMLVPSSIHPDTGKPYEWAKGASPWEIPVPEFQKNPYAQILILKDKIEGKAKLNQGEVKPTQALADDMLDVAAYLTSYKIPFTIREDPDRVVYKLKQCCFANNHTNKNDATGAAIIQNLTTGIVTYHCNHISCKDRTWPEARKSISGDRGLGEFMRRENWRMEEKRISTIEEGLLNADSFLRAQIPARQTYMSWIKEKSIILISGDKGVGKTWLGLTTADCITARKTFGPWPAEQAVSTLYVDAEMASIDIQDRLKQLTDKTREAPLIIYSDDYMTSRGFRRARLTDEGWRNQLKMVLFNKQFKVLFLDNLASLTPGIDENSKKDWDPINQWLIELRFAGITVILLHHLNRQGTQRGTSAREDNIDVSLTLRRPHDYQIDDGVRFVTNFSKNRIAFAERKQLVDMEFKLVEDNGVVSWDWTGMKRMKIAYVVKMLSDSVKQSTIAETLKVSRQYVSKVRQDAITQGYLTTKGELTITGMTLVSGLVDEQEEFNQAVNPENN
jgi:hypothetical protein